MFGIGKNNAAIDAFADELVADLRQRFPKEKEKELGGKSVKPARNLGRAAGELMDRRFAGFIDQYKIGVYGKARLLNRVKWQLREVGYTDEFIDTTLAEMTRIIARLSAPASRKKSG